MRKRAINCLKIGTVGKILYRALGARVKHENCVNMTVLLKVKALNYASDLVVF